MNNKWINSRKTTNLRQANKTLSTYLQKIKDCDTVPEDFKEQLINEINQHVKSEQIISGIDMYTIYFEYAKTHTEANREMYKNVSALIQGLNVEEYFEILELNKDLECYRDSAPTSFNGTIVVTDPCFIAKKGTDDWECSKYGRDLKALGLNRYIVRDTLCGNWNCNLIGENKKIIGHFTADSGQVCVAYLNEILEYNPDFMDNYASEVAIIQDFKGTIQFNVNMKRKRRTENSDFWNVGDEYESFSVYINGQGIDSTNNNKLNFVSKQI